LAMFYLVDEVDRAVRVWIDGAGTISRVLRIQEGAPEDAIAGVEEQRDREEARGSRLSLYTC
jgi:hypothetical protein